MLGAVPLLAAAWQFVLAACHRFRNHYGACAPLFPRTAVLIPAWNEGAVIGASIDRLLAARVPARAAAGLRGRRRQHRRHPAGGAGQGGAVPGPGGPPAPGARRPGQGAHAQPRPGGDPRRRLDGGAADHRRRRHLRARRAAHDDQAPGRPGGRRRHRLHQGGQPAGQLPDPVHRLRVHHRPGRRPARAERARRDRLPGRRRPAARAGQPGRPRRPHRHHLAGRGHVHHVRDPAARPPGGVRAARHLLGRGARLGRRAVEAAAALGARQRPGHRRGTGTCGSGRAARTASAASPSACCGSACSSSRSS